MMRYLWRASIAGDYTCIFLDACFLIGAACFERVDLVVLYGVMLILNLYSYDYQRRRDAGKEASE